MSSTVNNLLGLICGVFLGVLLLANTGFAKSSAPTPEQMEWLLEFQSNQYTSGESEQGCRHPNYYPAPGEPDCLDNCRHINPYPNSGGPACLDVYDPVQRDVVKCTVGANCSPALSFPDPSRGGEGNQ